MLPKVLAIDAGGTMTDTFIVDAGGSFVVGKAQSTPEDESIGFLNSCEDALSYWDLTVDAAFPSIVSGIYSGTAMINRLLEQKGSRLGLIVTAGTEDNLRMERGVQTYANYPYSDRLHVVTHVHTPALVPLERIKGVRERIDLFGNVVIPLYEHEADMAVRELMAQEVEAIVVCLLYSWRNPSHELKVKEIAQKVFLELGREVPLFLSSEYYPLQGDFTRMNTTVIEAYAAAPSRKQLWLIEDKIREHGGRFNLRIMAGHGGTVGIGAKELGKTLVSGPIGGVIGAKYLAERLGIDNVVCTDIGGTSFDMAVITSRDYHVRVNPTINRYLLSIPMIELNSVGAGTGSFVRIDPAYQRLVLGPDSAGSRIGVCWPEGGVDTVSITDCNLVLGLLNPEYFLGGKVRLDIQRAYQAIEEQIAKRLGLDVYEAASGVVELMEANLRNYLEAAVYAKGYSPSSFTLLSYGGGGPLHVAGYADGLGFEDILVPSWAAGFSAFGCACADFEYRSDIQVNIPVPPDADDLAKQKVLDTLSQAYAGLKETIISEFKEDGFGEEQVVFRMYVRMQYQGQLRDLEVGPLTLSSPSDIDALVREFEELYARVYARAARSPELGYFITRAILRGAVDVEKPNLPSAPVTKREPAMEAFKGERQVYWKGQWLRARLWEMDRLEGGNVVDGLAIVEAPATTLVVPPSWQAELDSHRIFHLKRA